jgi:hypothetical protein
MKEEIIRILTIFLLLITKTVKDLIQIFTDSLKKEPMFCADIKIINDTILFVLWLFLVSSLSFKTKFFILFAKFCSLKSISFSRSHYSNLNL